MEDNALQRRGWGEKGLFRGKFGRGGIPQKSAPAPFTPSGDPSRKPPGPLPDDHGGQTSLPARPRLTLDALSDH